MILNSYAQKAAFWTFYGRGHEASIVSQLLLHLDSSDPSRYNLYMTGEPEAIGMINVAKRLFDAGYNKECDSVLDLCKNIFPRESSHCGSLWKSTQVSYGLSQKICKVHSPIVKKYVKVCLRSS